MIRAAGLFLLLKHDNIRFCVCGYQDFLHRHIQQSAQSVQVVNGGQAFSSLPLVDCLGFFKAEVGLQIPNSHAAFLGFVGLEVITGIILAILLIFLIVEKDIGRKQAEIKARREQ